MSARGALRVSRDKVTGLVVALACLAFAAIGLQVNDPPEFGYVDAVREEVITIEQAQLSAGEVEVGTRLVRDGRVEAETTGMFVTVRTTLAVPGRQRVTLNRSRLITGNRTYDNWSHTALTAEPGFGQTQDLVFEVDPAQIDDLTLEIWYGGVVHWYYQRARIHLGITAANAADWRRAAAGRDLEPDPYGLTEALP
jgi:hypothetical protein